MGGSKHMHCITDVTANKLLSCHLTAENDLEQHVIKFYCLFNILSCVDALYISIYIYLPTFQCLDYLVFVELCNSQHAHNHMDNVKTIDYMFDTVPWMGG